MKNKKTIYLLGLVVIIVWGLIAYRVYAALNADDDNANIPAPAQIKEAYNDYTVNKDTATLKLNYRNPFNSTSHTVDTLPRAMPKTKIIARADYKPGFNWSGVKYSGYIRNPISKKLIAMMMINGRNTMLSEGESADDVRLLKNMRDSIRVRAGGQIKVITMNNNAQ